MVPDVNFSGLRDHLRLAWFGMVATGRGYRPMPLSDVPGTVRSMTKAQARTTWTLVNEMNRRGWSPHAWKPKQQVENTITRAIWALMDPGTDLELACVTTQGLLVGVNSDDRKRIGDQPLWGFLPQASPGPDLSPVDQRDRIRICLENKWRASPNAASYRRFDLSQRFFDSTAMSLSNRPRDDEYVPDGVWSNPGGIGPLLYQIDYYRCNSSWVRPQVTLDNADDVIWILLDREGRSATEVFSGAHTAHIWQTTSYEEFARRLLAGYDAAIDKGCIDRAEKLKGLVCMLAG
jgi:hypothetical protein